MAGELSLTQSDQQLSSYQLTPALVMQIPTNPLRGCYIMQGLAMSNRMVAIRQDCCSLIGTSVYAAVKFSSFT